MGGFFIVYRSEAPVKFHFGRRVRFDAEAKDIVKLIHAYTRHEVVKTALDAVMLWVKWLLSL